MELQIPRPGNGASENRGNTILTLAKASIFVDIYSTVMRSSFLDNGHWRFGMGIASLSKRASLSISPDRSSKSILGARAVSRTSPLENAIGRLHRGPR